MPLRHIANMTGFGSTKNSKNKKNRSLKNQDIQSFFVEAQKFELHGNLAKAEKAYEKIIKHGSFHSEAFLNLGALYHATGRWEKALSLYEQAIDINPNLAKAHFNLGVIYKDLGYVDHAREAILRFLELSPGNPMGLLNLMSVFDVEDLVMLKSRALMLVNQDDAIVEDLNFVEFVSSLGEDFYQELFSCLKSSVAIKDV